MFNELNVTTPEGVTFKYQLSGAGSRSIACILDIIIYFLLIILIVTVGSIIITIATSASARLGFDIALEPIVNILISAFILIIFLFIWGYRTIMEYKYSGSYGYKAMKIRVVTLRGNKPLFWQCALRGLLWPLEAVSFPLIGFISIISTNNSQRLGDLIAGTVVIHQNRDSVISSLRIQQAALDPNAPFRNWELSKVSDDEIFLIRRFLDRRTKLPHHIRLELANKLYKLIWTKVSGVPTDWYAEAVLEAIAASRAVANEH